MLSFYQRSLTPGLPRGRIWPSSCRPSRSFVLASLRALHLDLRRPGPRVAAIEEWPALPGAPAGPGAGLAAAVFRVEVVVDVAVVSEAVAGLLAGSRNWARLRDGMENRLGALGLVLNAVVLWTTRYIHAAVDQLRNEGHEIRDEDVARLSPL